jgi:CHAD domain-containing protein
MALEEIQYLLPEGLDAQAAGELLAVHLVLESERPRSVDRRFYDTFDGRLHGEGLTLAYEDGRLVLVDGSGHPRSIADELAAPGRLFASELAPGPLRDLLEPITEVRALTTTARVRSRLHPLRVLDDEAKTVVRVLVEEPVLVGPGGARDPLGPRVRLLPVRGYEKELRLLRNTLEGQLGLSEAPFSLQDEAVAAAGGRPGGTSTKLAIELERGERADRAAATALAAPLAAMKATMPGTLADVDIEFLHDLRVAVRRTRSLQRELKGVFPAEPLEHFRGEFRWLQQVTGDVRDLDVHRVELARFRAAVAHTPAADLAPLEEMIAARRQREFRRMTRALRSKRTTELIGAWDRFVEELPGLPEAGRPDAGRPIEDIVAERIRAVYRRMVKMGRAIDDGSPPEALHDLRKKGKELRYLLEFFAGLYPKDVVKPMVRTLKGLQDVLGRHQDQEVLAATLREMRQELAGREGGAAALMAMGVLVESLQQDHAAARREFAERFAPFAAKDRRRLVEATFA